MDGRRKEDGKTKEAEEDNFQYMTGMKEGEERSRRGGERRKGRERRRKTEGVDE